MLSSDLTSFNLSFLSIQWRLYLPSRVVRAAWNNLFIVTLVVISFSKWVGLGGHSKGLWKGGWHHERDGYGVSGIPILWWCRDELRKGACVCWRWEKPGKWVVRPCTQRHKATVKSAERKGIQEGGIKGFGEHRVKCRKWNPTEKNGWFQDEEKHQTSRRKY